LTALVEPFAVLLFWSWTSSVGFIAGVVVSQLATASLLLVSFEVAAISSLLELKL